MMSKLTWKPVDQAPRTGNPFWLGTKSGGVMLEAWHWCSECGDYKGCFSEQTIIGLRASAPDETFLFAEMQAPARRH